MPANTLTSKVACLNPNTGRSMNIDKATYDLFSKAIFHTLKKKKDLTFTEVVDGVKDCFREQKTKFDGAIDWYSITVKNDMHARGVIEVLTEKGRKLHRLKK